MRDEALHHSFMLNVYKKTYFEEKINPGIGLFSDEMFEKSILKTIYLILLNNRG